MDVGRDRRPVPALGVAPHGGAAGRRGPLKPMDTHLTSTPRRAPHRRRRGALAVLVAAAVVGSGCTGALRSSDGGSTPTTAPAERLDAWPDSPAAVTTTSPAYPDVEIGVRPLIREPDGTTTLLIDVTNDDSRSVDSRDLFGFDRLAAADLLTDAGVRHQPVCASGGGCLASGDRTIEPGATATLHATFASVAAETEEARVALPRWRPADGVPVETVAGFATESSVTTAMEEDPDHEVVVGGAWRTPEGILVRIDDVNGTGDELETRQLVDLDGVTIVDPATLRSGSARRVDGDPVREPSPEDPVAAGESARRHVLVADLADRPSRILVTIPGVRRTLPVEVRTGAVPEADLPTDGLDDPTTFALDGARRTERDPAVALGEPEDVPIDETGPAVELPDAGPELTSEAQPGWSFAPRAVVRISDERSVLYTDLSNQGGDGSWPTGPGYDLDEVALIDPARDQRLGVLLGAGNDTLGSSSSSLVHDGESRTVHVAFPPVAEGSTSVTVDVPGFGRAEDVPVIEGPELAPQDAAVASSMPSDGTGRLRIDVLDVGRLPGDTGTLVRLRRVNDTAPDAYEPPTDICDVSLSDADSDRRFEPLSPCVSTEWTRSLGTGEGLVYELRFPTLPDDVQRVTADLEGWLGSGPVRVTDGAEPWYLDLPRAADAPEGDTLVGSIGVADDLQTEVRSGDEVDLNLDTDVLFAFGSAELTPEATARLRQVAERLAGEVSGTVEVVGHTDSVGDDAANQTLSEQRAQAVADVLAATLGSSVELDVEGRGESEPVADNEVDGRADPDGQARNRRVTVTYDAR